MVVAAACGDQTAVDTTLEGVVPTTTAAPVTTLPTTEDAVEEPVSQAALEDSLVFPEGYWLSRVVAGGPGYVGVGGLNGDAAVWVSPDGTTWSRIIDDEVLGGRFHEFMQSVVATDSGLIGVGGDGRDALVWTSADGTSWSRVEPVGDEFTGFVMNDIAEGGPGFVAVGTIGGEQAEDLVKGAVWVSADGMSWERIAFDEEAFGLSQLEHVVNSPNGLVSFGFTCSEESCGPLTWTSTDGRAWTRRTPSLPAESWIGRPTVGGQGLVVPVRVGFDTEAVAAIYGSTDGIRWEPTEVELSEFYSSIQAIITSASGLVAVGYDGGDGAVWTSGDGLVWARVPDEAGVFAGRTILSAAAGPHGLVALGGRGHVWTSPDAATWNRVDTYALAIEEQSSSMAAVTPGGPGLVAVGSAGEDAAVWVSSDGQTWQRLALDGEDSRGSYMEDVAAGEIGLVAVGEDVRRSATGIWFSPDGLEWTKAPYDESVFGGEGNHADGVIESASGMAVIGHYDLEEDDSYNDLAVWLSNNGLDWSRLPHDEEVFGAGTIEVDAVTKLGSKIVAMGMYLRDENAEDPDDGAVWVSETGTDWIRAPLPRSTFWLSTIGTFGSNLVVMGSWCDVDWNCGTGMWTSADGLEWTEDFLDDQMFGDAWVTALVEAGPGLVAAGSKDDRAGVWVSSDGVDWTPVSDGQEVFGLRSHISDLTAWDGGLVAVGSANEKAAVWTSTDGTNWTLVFGG
jgi:hypothetical protein